MKNLFGDDDDGIISPEVLTEMLSEAFAPDELYRQTKNMMWSMVQYKEMQMVYECALKEIRTKFDVLNTEFELQHKRNPIASVNTRLKRTQSIAAKLIKYRVQIGRASCRERVSA